MAKLSEKLKASTLLEVIVAMVVILIVFVLSTGIYANVIRSSPLVKQQRIKALMAGLIQQSMDQGNLKEEVVFIDSISFETTVNVYQGYADLLLVSIVAVEQGNEVGKTKRIFKVDGNGY